MRHVVHVCHNGAWRVGRPEDRDAFASVLLVGEDNPQSSDPRMALWASPTGCAGDRLRGILGLPHVAYYAMWRTNLCNPTWSRPMAESRARELLYGTNPWRTVVLLGSKVAGVATKVLGTPIAPMAWVPHWYEDDDGEHEVSVACIPHPSGRNLFWNDAGNRPRARELLAKVAPSIPWGSLGEVPAEVAP